MDIDNLSGRQLGPYELHELLGVGGMGVVYRAYQPRLKRWVAIKVLSTMTLRRVNYVERFHREAETAGSLEHRHIIPIYDYGTERNTYYVVMRLLEGGTLDERLAQHVNSDSPLPSLGEIADVLDQLASALDYAHSRGVIHRDIKPSNIMFDTQGSAYIVDFGIAKLLETTETLTRSGVSLGTPVYMAPEQWRAEALGPATDQYALGGLTYTLVTGHLPFEVPTAYAQMHKHLHEDPISPRQYRPDLPEALEPVLARAMAKDPNDRFPTVSDFANAFTDAIAENPGKYTGYFVGTLQKQHLFAYEGMQDLDGEHGVAIDPNPTPVVTMPEVPYVEDEDERAVSAAAESEVEAAEAPENVWAERGTNGHSANGVGNSATDENDFVATDSDEVYVAGRVRRRPFYRRPMAGVATLAIVGMLGLLTLTRLGSAESPPRGPADTPSDPGQANAVMSATALQQTIVALRPTDTPEPTSTATPTLTDTPSATPTNTDVPAESRTATALALNPPTATASPTNQPTHTPEPTLAPSETPRPTDTAPPPTETLVPPSATPEPTDTAQPDWLAVAAAGVATAVGGGGGQLAFVSERDRNAELYKMELDGSPVERLTVERTIDTAPAWSPDGTRIAFVSERYGNRDIFVLEADTGSIRRLTREDTADYEPAWSPDGRWIAFVSDRDGNPELYVMDETGGSLRRLTEHFSADTSPSWSPDGSRLAFVSDREGSPDIYIMDANQEIVRLTEDPSGATQPAWSPDGNWIAYVSQRDGNANIYRRELASDRLDRLTEDPGEDLDPAWSPDGNWIAFASNRDGNREVYLLDLLAREEFRVTADDSADYYPVWQYPADYAGNVEVQTCTVIAARSGVRIRVGPGTDRGIVGLFQAGTGRTVIGWSKDDNNDSLWWKIEVEDVDSAWVAQSDMIATGSCLTVPASSAPPIQYQPTIAPTNTRPPRDTSTPAPAFDFSGSAPRPRATSTPRPTATRVPPTRTPRPTNTRIPPTNTPRPTATNTPRPTDVPTATPRPTDIPTATPRPTDVPTAVPTDLPTAIPTDPPTAIPTEVPTEPPTEEPTSEPPPDTEAAVNPPPPPFQIFPPPSFFDRSSDRSSGRGSD